MRQLARAAALEGADVVRSSRAPSAGETKGLPGDWVTEADRASERAIKAFLGEAAPEIPFQGEELGGNVEGLRWVVDPLDGTTNFVHGFMAVGVSVALVEDERRSPARSRRRSSASAGTRPRGWARAGSAPAAAGCPAR